MTRNPEPRSGEIFFRRSAAPKYDARCCSAPLSQRFRVPMLDGPGEKQAVSETSH